MASTLLDQIKIMLKSASYAIFTRIGRAEKNVQSLTDQVSNLKNQIPTKPPKITFRQESSNEYTCDLTFDDLWAMEPEIIASNTILIDRYGIAKAARSARKAGSVEYGMRNIQIDIDGSFEADMVTYFKPTLIIDWWAHTDEAVINVHSASSLSNETYQANGVPNVPIFQNGNWANCEVGKGLEVVGGVLSAVGGATNIGLPLLASVEVKEGDDIAKFSWLFEGATDIEVFALFPVASADVRVTGRIGTTVFYLPNAFNSGVEMYYHFAWTNAPGRYSFRGTRAGREAYTSGIPTVGVFLKPVPSNVSGIEFTLNPFGDIYPVGTKIEIYGK